MKRKEEWIKLLCGYYKEKKDFSFREKRKIYSLYLKNLNELDGEVIEIIEKDVERTKIKGKKNENFLECIERKNVVKRVLMVYALTNKSVGYIQGMNWICSILYYVMVGEEEDKYTECLTYFCFFGLMVDMGDLFCEKMDETIVGMSGYTMKILKIVKKEDKGLYKWIIKKQLMESSSFHLRWMFLLFSAEFSIEETLFLWDRLFKEIHKCKLVPYICASILIISKPHIFKKPVHETLLYLQSPSVKLKETLKKAETLMDKEIDDFLFL